MGSTTAVLDVGKTHVRVCLIDAEGRLVDARRRANCSRPGPPYAHLDVDGVFTWVCAALAELGAGARIEAVVPVAHGAAAALVAGRALALPVMDYEHALPPLDPATLDPAETLSPVLPFGLNLATQLAWQQEHRAQDFARADTLLLHPQYWAWRLGGRPVAEVTSLGCHTQLWAPSAGRPSSLAAARGWDALLPELVPAWECVGRLSAEVVARTGLPPDCRVHAGIHDSNASLLVHRVVRDEPFAVVSTGTWVVTLACGGDLDGIDLERDMLVGVDALGEPVPAMRFLGGREYATLAGGRGLAARPATADVQAVLDAGLLARPCFASGGGPFAGRVGAVVPAAPSEPVARAALAALYVALMIDLSLEDLGGEGDVIVEGPMAANAALVGTLAALRCDRRVFASRDETGTARGAALLADWGRPVPPPSLERVQAAALRGLAEHRTRWRDQSR